MINEHDIEAFKRFKQPEQLEMFMEDTNPNFYDKVYEFHKAFKHPTERDLAQPDANEFWLRWRLISEEFKELGLEFTKADEYLMNGVLIPDIIRRNILKETADLLYVVFGFCVTYNLPIEEAFMRVHRSNMSKLGADGKPIYREDGKVSKGPNYKEPNLKGLV